MPTAAALRAAANRRAERTTCPSAAPRSENTSCPATLPAGTAGARDGQCVTDAARRRRPRASRIAQRATTGATERIDSAIAGPNRKSLSGMGEHTKQGARLQRRTCAPGAIRRRPSDLRAPARAANTRAPFADERIAPRGLAAVTGHRASLRCPATSDQRACASNVAATARWRGAACERATGTTQPAGPARGGKLIDPRPACPPSPTRRAAPR